MNEWLNQILGSNLKISRIKSNLSSRETFRVKTRERIFIVKKYADRTKMNHDIQGSLFARDVAHIQTPTIIAVNDKLRTVILGFIHGCSLSEYLMTNKFNERTFKIIESFGRVVSKLHNANFQQTKNFHRLYINNGLKIETKKLEESINYFKSLLSQSGFSDNYIPFYKNRLLENLNSIKLFCYLLKDKLKERDSEIAVIHGDLWSGNVLLMEEKKSIKVGLFDFEWSSLGNPVVDISRIYSRGLVPRNLKKRYSVIPPPKLWEAFCKGYNNSKMLSEKGMLFKGSLIYSHIRTINYYKTLIELSYNNLLNQRILKTIFRISSSLVDYLQL